jgi:hypothetical protein
MDSGKFGRAGHVWISEDHVRLYSRDLKPRIEGTGFACEILTTDDLCLAGQALYLIKSPLYREVAACEYEALFACRHDRYSDKESSRASVRGHGLGGMANT